MTDIVERLRAQYDAWNNPPSPELPDGAGVTLDAAAEIERLRAAYSLTQDAVQQTLGRALGYPWFKDDQHNFPGATEADGVCVGDHVAESIADETAAKIAALQAALLEAIEFASLDEQCLTPAGEAMVDRWRTALGGEE